MPDSVCWLPFCGGQQTESGMIPGLECFSVQYYDCAITYVYTYVYASRVINVYTYVGSYCHANVYYAQIKPPTYL